MRGKSREMDGPQNPGPRRDHIADDKQIAKDNITFKVALIPSREGLKGSSLTAMANESLIHRSDHLSPSAKIATCHEERYHVACRSHPRTIGHYSDRTFPIISFTLLL